VNRPSSVIIIKTKEYKLEEYPNRRGVNVCRRDNMNDNMERHMGNASQEIM